jgi:hypothetical protein
MIGRLLVVTALVASLAACATTPEPLSETAFTDAYTAQDATWLPLPESPLSARSGAVGVAVGQRFLVAGGDTGFVCPPNADCSSPAAAVADGAIFDPQSGVWQRIADAPIPFMSYSAVAIGNTVYVLAAGTGATNWISSVLAYDVTTDSWSTLPAEDFSWGALVAAGNTLVVISGSDENTVRPDVRYDAEAGTWVDLPDDPLGPSFDREAVWTGDRLLLVGKDLAVVTAGGEPSFVRLASLDLSTNEWTRLPDSDIIGWAPRAVGDYVVFPSPGGADGGEVDNWGREIPYGGIFQLATGEWKDLGVGDGRYGDVAFATVVGERIVIGNSLLDPATGETTRVPGLPGQSRVSATAAGSDDSLFVWGGSIGADHQADGYLIRF